MFVLFSYSVLLFVLVCCIVLLLDLYDTHTILYEVWNEIYSSCAELASFNARDMKRQLAYAGVTVVEGYAKFDAPETTTTTTATPRSEQDTTHRLVVSSTTTTTTGKERTTQQLLTADKILLATGSRPYQPSSIPFDGQRVFDSDSINGLQFLPKSVVITGRYVEEDDCSLVRRFTIWCSLQSAFQFSS